MKRKPSAHYSQSHNPAPPEQDDTSSAEITDDEEDDEDEDEDEDEEADDDTSSKEDEDEAAAVASQLSEEASAAASRSAGEHLAAVNQGGVSVQPTSKRKRAQDGDDIEEKYFSRLMADESEHPRGKKTKVEETQATGQDGDSRPGEEAATTSSDESDAEEDDGAIPVHESLAGSKETSLDDVDKAARTVFLSNVSSEAITSKLAKKTLLTHMSSVLDKTTEPPQKVESIRFRSVAFAAAGIPKKAAFVTKQIMSATTRSTNAYVVYSTPAAARAAAAQLNGSEVLGRHIRVDSVAHPSPVDHRRCVFVGNLGFVDDETVLNATAEGETAQRKRNKVPADVDEGLWQVFGSRAGKVESVRVPRDPKTRVGKGFAYVQFYVCFESLHARKITNSKDRMRTASRPRSSSTGSSFRPCYHGLSG